MDAKLIERLRLSGNPDCWTAADEIEALQSTIRALSKGDIVPISDKDAEIERLRAALKPFAEVGQPFVKACETGAIPSGASARYLKLEPLIAEDFANAAKVLGYEQYERPK